jgi:hypothetical protein
MPRLRCEPHASTNLEDGFDFDRRTKGERANPHGRTRMPACLTEDVGHQVRCPVYDGWLVREM